MVETVFRKRFHLGRWRFLTLKVGKYDNAQMETGRMFMEMGISLDLQSEIYQRLLGGSSLWGISIPEVLNDLESEHERPIDLKYF